MKKIFIVAFIFLVLLSGCGYEEEKTELSGIDISDMDIGKNGVNIPVIRGYATKMVAFLIGNKNDINNADNYINFTDVSYDNLYGKYVNFCFKNNIIKGTQNLEFEPEKYLTLSQVQYFINAFDKTGEIKIHITEETKDKPVSLSLWNEIYKKLIQITENKDIEEIEFSIFADKSMFSGIKDNYVITDKGVFCCDLINISAYKNCRCRGLIKGKDIISITEIIDKMGFASNAYIKKVEKNYATIFLNGTERIFKFQNDIIDEKNIGNICDLYFIDDEILECILYEDKISGIVKIADNEKIEISSAGILNYEENTKIYIINGEEIKQGNISQLIIGRKCEFILDGGKIKAVIINGEYIPNELYVQIKNSGKDYFDEITVIKDKEEIKINKDELNGRIIIEKGVDNLILKIGNSQSEISGIIEIIKNENGLIILNKTEIERYTMAVTAKKVNDMSDANEEMLKLIAVLTRTEILRGIYDNKMAYIGASADNSNTAYPNENVKKAVEATKGEVILYDDEVISPFYFYSSIGTTANNGEVWVDKEKGNYPWKGTEYLSAYVFKDTYKGKNLSEEKEFKEIVDNLSNDLQNGDEWQRWEYTISIKNIEESINSQIENLCLKYGDYIKVLEADGIYRSKKISQIGNIKEIKVNKRGEGGNVMEIIISGTKNVVMFRSMPVISKILVPTTINVKKADNSQISLNYVPSMFFCIESLNDYIKIYGGGLGHGVGLSMKDAEKMSKNEGYTDIIKKFYQGVYIEKM